MGMRILALDTTGDGCSVAVTENRGLVAEINFNKKETHSRHLMGIIDDVLKMASLTVRDMDGFAVSRGPGSFTGLRIGLSTIKGLAFVTDKPLVGVSSLEALAMGVTCPDLPICALIDARKNEVYMACYRVERGRLVTEIPAVAVGADALCETIRTRTVFVGTGLGVFGETIKEKLGDLAVFMPPSFHSIRASHVAELSFERFDSATTDSTELLTPHYIRKSDAELNRREPIV